MGHPTAGNGNATSLAGQPVSGTPTVVGQALQWTGSAWSPSTSLSPAATALDVASTGAGPQATTVRSYAPPDSGLYRIQVCVINGSGFSDVVSVQVTYKDDVLATTQTVGLMSSTTVSAGSCASSPIALARARAGQNIIVQLTLSSQTGTTVSAVIERHA